MKKLIGIIVLTAMTTFSPLSFAYGGGYGGGGHFGGGHFGGGHFGHGGYGGLPGSEAPAP